MTTYHPNPGINAEVSKAAVDAEVADLAAGYPARRWMCPKCSASHARGFFMAIGQHRCLGCGYVGDGGVMWDPQTEPTPGTAP